MSSADNSESENESASGGEYDVDQDEAAGHETNAMGSSETAAITSEEVHQDPLATKSGSKEASAVAATSSAEIAHQDPLTDEQHDIGYLEIKPANVDNAVVGDNKEKGLGLSLMHVSLDDENTNENNESDCVFIGEFYKYEEQVCDLSCKENERRFNELGADNSAGGKYDVGQFEAAGHEIDAMGSITASETATKTKDEVQQDPLKEKSGNNNGCNEAVEVGQNKEFYAFKIVSTEASAVAATSSAEVAHQDPLTDEKHDIAYVEHMEIEPANVDNAVEEKSDLSLMPVSLDDENINENNESDCAIIGEFYEYEEYEQ